MMGRAFRVAGVGAWACVVALAGAGGAEASVRIHLVDGGTIEGLSCSFREGVAIVEVEDGGTLGFPSSRIARVEPVDDPVPVPAAVLTAPAPDAAPANPATVAAAPQVAVAAAPQTPPHEEPPSIDALIRKSAERHNLEPELLAAVIAVESGYRARAISPKGAQGLMQLMPATSRDLDLRDPFDPAMNIEAGAAYLRQLIDRHGNSFVKVLAAYNAGTGRVTRQKGIPPYRETVQYIERVLRKYAAATQHGIASLNPGK